MAEYVRVLKTGEIVRVHFRFADGVIGYIGKYGVKILYDWEYEEV